MRKVILTGVNGFVGHHLARELWVKKFSVIGTGTSTELSSVLKPFVDEYVGNCDLTKEKDVSRLDLEDVIAVINLAGLSNVGASFDMSEEYLKLNVGVHTKLADRIYKEGLKIRMVSVSSGAIYDAAQTMPLKEDSSVITEGSPYALSKIAMEQAMKAYVKKGLDIVIARPFNHTGPGQLAGFLIPDLYEQIQNALLNNVPLSIGNLETKRDYSDVRDVVQAYILLATAEKKLLSGYTYNVCSGKSVAGTRILELIANACGVSNIKRIIDPEKLRPNDALDVFGSYNKIHSELGWKPTIGIEKTIDDFVKAKKNRLFTI